MKPEDRPSPNAGIPLAVSSSANLPTTVNQLASVPGVRFNPASEKPVKTVFIHGVLASTSMWKGICAGPVADLTAALPLPGHYPWSLSPDDTDAALHEDSFLALHRDWIADNADGPVHLIGHSAGSVAALKFAARYPPWVDRLTLMGAFADGPGAVGASALARTVALPVIGGAVFERLYHLWLRSVDWFDAGLATAKPRIVPAADERTLSAVEKAMLSDLRRSDPQSLRRVVLWLQHASVRNQLETIDAPTTIIVCQDDPVVSLEKQMELVHRLPNASAIIVHAGHLPMLEAPQVLRNLLPRIVNADSA